MTKLYDKSCFWHWNFAHRGLHDVENGLPENSLAAFKAARDAGYGAELDVQLSKDGQVMVFHDDTLKRVCNEDGAVHDYTKDELQKFSLSGLPHTIPLFTEVLDEFGKGSGPLIVEIKTCKNFPELCQKTYDILKKYSGIYCVESFNPLIVKWFKDHAPEIFRGQLVCQESGYDVINVKFVRKLLVNCAFAFLGKPDFIAYENVKRPKHVMRLVEKGAMLIGWTSRVPDIDQEKNDAVIFEKYRPAPRY